MNVVGFNQVWPQLVTKHRRDHGFTFIEHGYSADNVYEVEELDSLLVTLMVQTVSLGDGMPRLQKIRDAIDDMLREEGRRKLGLSR